MPAIRNKNKGKRFQGKGWRDPIGGSLYFQLKRESFSRCHEVSPRTTMEQLINGMKSELLGSDDYPDLADGLEFAFYLRKQPLEPSQERAFTIFDGGETVYIRVVDEEGTQYVQNYVRGGETWIVKTRGSKPKLEDLLAQGIYGEVEAHRLGLLK